MSFGAYGTWPEKPVAPPRPEPVATADLVERARLQAAWLDQKYQGLDQTPLLLTDLADRLDELEDTTAERDRALATLRDIADGVRPYASARRLARERLANP